MISVKRVSAVIEKDFVWAMGNMKLLGIMLLPIFFVLLFSQLDSEKTFTYAITFVIAFVGLFNTSYLVIEEKGKGTLLALLTSPLKNHELLIGKFGFALTLCTTFSLFAIIMNNRLDILANPLILLNFILFSGTTCFLGYIIGVFFKNEQEMSIAAPFLLVLFFLGETINRASDSETLFAYFPDYHFAKTISSAGVSLENLIVHTGFNLLYFLGALLFASWYTKFYFSNSRESRISSSFYAVFGSFIGLYVLSGLISPTFVKMNDKIELADGTTSHSISTDLWSAEYKFDPKNEKVKSVVEMKNLRVSSIKPNNMDKNEEYILSLRKAEKNESNIELREKKIREDKDRFVVGMEPISIKNIPFRKWTYYKDKKMIILAEAFCDDQLLQISADVKDPNIESIKKSVRKLDSIINNISPSCSKMEAS